MKRFILTLCVCLGIATSWAQIDSRYDKGNVPVVNGRVFFEKNIPTLLSQGTTYKRLNEWAQQRFNKPNTIVSKFTTEDATNGILGITAEEYIVFTNRFFVLDRTRINYWIEFQCADGSASIKMTRINYWYEEERDGGLKFSAEDFITDEQAFNKKGDKMHKDQEKFRRGTIDFFDNIVAELTHELSAPLRQSERQTAATTATVLTDVSTQTIDTTTLVAPNNAEARITTIE